MLLFLNDIAGSEVLLILMFILMFFGSKSIPGIAKTFGKTMYQIKQASNDLQDEIKKQLGHLIAFNSTNAAFIRFELEAIKQLLNNLPAREKEMIELHLQGYKNEEIAVQLNISYNTVRNTLHNAKQRIKKLWQLFM